jgi:trigger factor
LEVKINEVSLSEHEIDISLNYDEVKADIDDEIKKQTKKIQMPGFRKGKVPPAMIKKMYGDALDYEASEKVANKKFWEAAKEKDLKPIGQPVLTDIKFLPGESLSFKVRYEVIPELDVKEYTDNEIEAPNFEARDEDVEHEIIHIRRSNSSVEEVDEVGTDKNYIIKVDLQRIDENDSPFENSKPETIDIDLSNPRVQADIVENAKGKKIGESFDFSFSDPVPQKDDSQKEAEQFNYRAVIKGIKKIALPELNEELIKKVTKEKHSDEKTFREEIKKDIQNYYDQRMNEIIRDKILKLIIDKNNFVPPKALVKNILDDLVKKEEENAKKDGHKNFDRNEAANRLKNLAEVEVKWFLLKNAIQKKENISVSDEDLQELVKKDAEKTGLPEDKLLAYYKSSNYGEKLLDQKLFDFLIEKNKINKIDPEKFSKKETEEINEK